MNSNSNHPVEKFLFGIALGVILLLCFGLSGSPGAHAQEVGTQTPTDTAVVIDPTGTPTPTATIPVSETIVIPTETPQPKGYFWVRPLRLSSGTTIEEMIIHGPPFPPPGLLKKDRPVASLQLQESVTAAGISILSVPAFNWVYGCSAVSGAMIAGYYDRNGYPNIYTGPTNGGVMPLDNSSWSTWNDGVYTYRNNPLTASMNGVDGRSTRGSIDDYWVQYNSSASDPYITGGWAQHTWGDAIGDYMRTSQSHFNGSTKWGLGDAYTRFYDIYPTSATPLTCANIESYTLNNSYPPDGTLGRKQFYEARGYTVTDCYNQYTDNIVSGGFSFSQYKAEIDAGRPVMLNLAGHTIAGVGYDSSTNTVYLNDTWDSLTHSMTWGGSYAGMELQAVSIVNLAPTRPDLSITGLTVLPTAPLTNQDIQVTVDVANLTDVASTTFRTDLYIDGQWSRCWGVGIYFKRLAGLAGNTTNSLLITIPAGTLSAGTHTISAYVDSGCEADETSEGNNNAAPVSVVISEPPPNSFTLTSSVAGTGSGTVAGTGIACPGDCSEIYNIDTSVTLTATPATGSTFTGWSGDCSGTGTCTVTMTAARSVTATFTIQSYILDISTAGTGSGTVAGTGIACPGDCSEIYNYGTSVTLTVTPATGSTFTGWSGACTGTGACSVSMTAAQSVTATFAIQTYALDIILSGTGSGTVTGTGIACPGDCSEIFNYGTSVTLTATPATGSTFTGWSGACTGTGACTVSMTAARSVTATFSIQTFALSISVAGAGSGTVTGTGIACPGDCSEIYNIGTSVSLTAAPSSSNSEFTAWSGDAIGLDNPVQVTMTADRSVTAQFTLSTFGDVPFNYTATLGGVGYPLHAYIQALYDAHFTAGCLASPLSFCPDNTMTRAESAVFMLRGQLGADYVPPVEPWDTFFDNWSLGTWAEKWAEGMWQEGLTAGCQVPGNQLMFCPWDRLPRVQGAVFGLKIKYGTNYAPLDATGTLFADMTDTSFYGTKWAEQAYLDGLLPACGTDPGSGKPLFCPDDQVTRAWGAYLIVKAKNLPLVP